MIWALMLMSEVMLSSTIDLGEKLGDKMMGKIYVLTLLVAMSLAIHPAAAYDCTLGIFGNANLDETIDQKDIDYLRGIIEDKNLRTNLSDANYDGEIDEEDLVQIEKIINGEETELIILDGNGDAVAVKKPVERIIVEYLDNAELVSILNAKDKIVGIDYAVAKSGFQFPDLSKLPNVGAMYEPDYEAVLSQHPDLLLTFSPLNTQEKAEHLPGVDVVFLGLYYPDLSNPEGSKFTDGVRKLGYILDEEDRAEEYLNWRMDWINYIKSNAKNVPENHRPKVLIGAYPYSHLGTDTFRTFSKIDTLTQMAMLTGVKVVAEDLPDFFGSSYKLEVDPEWVLEEDPDFIVLHLVAHTYSGVSLDPPNGYDADEPIKIGEARKPFMNLPQFALISAIENEDVYLECGSFRNDATGGLVGAAYMAKLFLPEVFSDLDPEEIHQEYTSRFLGLDYDLDEHGIFVYPPIIKGEGQLAGVPDRYYEEILAQQ